MKKIILSIFIVSILSFAPQAAQAQVVIDDSYRAALLELIIDLQKQIAVLEQQLALKQSSENPHSFSDQVKVVVSYPVTSLDKANLIPNKQHREYFEQVADIVPVAYHDYFKELVVFTEDEWFTDAYVETVPPKHNEWRYAVNEEVLFDDYGTSQDNELIVHEFAHVLSYEQIIGVAQPANIECSDYFKQTGCPLQSSYLGKFVADFWTERDLARAQGFRNSDDGVDSAYEYYELNKSYYVSDYAALSPEEDFSETFSYFVLKNSSGNGNSVKDNKIKFFYQFPELLEMRASIRLNL